MSGSPGAQNRKVQNMSHEIDVTDGVASFVSAHTAAWHQLGNTLEKSFTAQEAMVEGRLGDWDVRKVPMTAIDPKTKKTIAIPGKYATVRDNPVKKGQVDVLGAGLGEGYQVVQNEEHAAFLDELVDESGAHYDTAGALRGGSQVFLAMKLPGHINVGGVDPVENYIAAINSHDGSKSFTMMVTPVRIVCANTLAVAFQNHSNIIRVRHSSGALKNLAYEARRVLDVSFNYLDAFQKEAEMMIQTTLTDSKFEEIVNLEFGADEDAATATKTRSENKIEEILELFAHANTQDGIRNTVWAGFNALTEWADHFAPTRGDDKDNARAEKALLDPYLKTDAHRLMMSLV